MKKYLLASILSLAPVFGQSAETLFFVADMRGANEVPAVETASFGSAAMVVHVVKDAQGRVVSGTVDFNITAQFADAATVVGLHIHNGAAGTNGPVTVDTGITGANNVPVTAGRTLIQRSAQVSAGSAAGVATLEGLLSNPNGFYVNLHTLTNPGGMFRGQLYRAERRTFSTTMLSSNEVPAVEGTHNGIGSFLGLRAFDAQGRYISGGGMFVVNYNLTPVTAGGATTPQRVVGLHIHRGAAGVNGPVVLDSGLNSASAFDTAANGVGTVTYVMAAPPDAPAAVSALNDMWDAPAGFYMNMHTVVSPGGIIRGQMRAAENVTMSVLMSPANEVPAITGLDATAPATVQIDAVRNAAGAVTHALVLYSVNYRFPGEATFVGLHIHEGAAGANGPVRIDSAITGANNVPSANGIGNVFRVFNASTEAALAAVNGLLASPDGYYLNIHTTVNPGGAVRAQLAEPNTARPRVLDFISGVSDPNLKVAARGGLMTAFGENLFRVGSTLLGTPALPPSVNGTSASVGGSRARVLAMGNTGGTPPQYMVMQVPFDAPTGPQDLVVSNSNGAGAAFATSVAAAAPGLYYDTQGIIALRADFTLVRPNAPAAGGEPIGLLATGLGVTTPALDNGQFAPAAPVSSPSQTITATIGGRPAQVISTIALPGYAGVYLVGVMVPTGLTPGAQMVQIRAGDVASNSVALTVR